MQVLGVVIPHFCADVEGVYARAVKIEWFNEKYIPLLRNLGFTSIMWTENPHA